MAEGNGVGVPGDMSLEPGAGDIDEALEAALLAFCDGGPGDHPGDGRRRRETWLPPPDWEGRSPTEAEVWAMVVGSERLLRREVRRLLPRARLGELDQMFSDVVVGRCHRIMATYKPDYVSPKTGRRVAWLTHLVSACRWYAYKWVHGRNGHWGVIRKEVVGGLRDADAAHAGAGSAAGRLSRTDAEARAGDRPGALSEQERAAGVSLMLSSLDPADADLILWRAHYEFDFGEIGAHIGTSAAVARLRYIAAVGRAREKFWAEGPAGDFLRAIRDELDMELEAPDAGA